MRTSDGNDKPSTQKLLPIREVRDGVSVLSDGTLRSTLIVSSLNFALKSEEEQNAIIYAYQDFLNSLDFPVQITVMSRKLDITPYLEGLNERREKQANELLRLQMAEYGNFVGELVKGNNIMTKTFLVTVSFAISQSKGQSKSKIRTILNGITPVKKQKERKMDDAEFERYRKQLMQRVEQVAVGLRNIGLRLAPLQTQELLELFYNSLNPNTSRNQRLHNVAQVQVEESDPTNLLSDQKEKKPWVGG